MKTHFATPRLSPGALFACVTMVLTHPANAQQTEKKPEGPEIVSAGNSGAAELHFTKNKPRYLIEDDKMLSVLDTLAHKEPKYSSGTGVANIGGVWAEVTIQPTTGKLMNIKYYTILIHNVETTIKPGGQLEKVGIFKLEECLIAGDTTHVRDIGWYDSVEILNKLKRDILFKSGKIKTNAAYSEALLGKMAEPTVADFGLIIDKAMYLAIEGILTKNAKVAETDASEPFAWIAVYPEISPAWVMRRPGSKTYRVGVYGEGKMRIYEITGDPTRPSGSSVRNLGMFFSLHEWDQLRLKVVSLSKTVSEK